MNTKIRYDLDSLELANGDFGYPITEKEVRKVNRMLELMENVRSRQMCPTEGDCVEFVSRSGDYFGKAHIVEKPRDFDPFGQAGFAHLWLQYD